MKLRRRKAHLEKWYQMVPNKPKLTNNTIFTKYAKVIDFGHEYFENNLFFFFFKRFQRRCTFHFYSELFTTINSSVLCSLNFNTIHYIHQSSLIGTQHFGTHVNFKESQREKVCGKNLSVLHPKQKKKGEKKRRLGWEMCECLYVG